MKRSLLATGLLAAAFAAIMIVGVARADKPSQPASTTTTTGNIDTGIRPPGRIAYIRDGGIWIMDSDGKNRQKVSAVTNAKGRISFSPDNKMIAFSREGKDANKLPTDEGGMHLLHDVFIAFVDSASTNTNWWKRVTFGLGGFNPQWSANDTLIYFQNDLNANYVDYIVPSHVAATVSVTDGHAVYLRKDWQTLNTWMVQPSITRDGKKIAYVISYSHAEDNYNFQKKGIRIIDMDSIMIPESEMRKPSPGLGEAVAPSWSPDGHWLAYVSNDMRDAGIFIVSSDLKDMRQIFASTMTQQVSPEPIGWAPNSKWITFATMDGVIYTVDINGNNLKELTGAGNHSNPTWSN
jgi:Tol biopolymer transport system component